MPSLRASIWVTQVVSRRRPTVFLPPWVLTDWRVGVTKTAAAAVAARDTLGYWETAALVIVTILRRDHVKRVWRGVRWWPLRRWDTGRRRGFQCWISARVIVQICPFRPSLSPFSVVSAESIRVRDIAAAALWCGAVVLTSQLQQNTTHHTTPHWLPG